MAPPNPHRRISNALRLTRLSHQAIGEYLGLERAAVSMRMNGRTKWSLADAIQVAHLLECPLDELVKDGEDMPTDHYPVLTEASA